MEVQRGRRTIHTAFLGDGAGPVGADIDPIHIIVVGGGIGLVDAGVLDSRGGGGGGDRGIQGDGINPRGIGQPAPSGVRVYKLPFPAGTRETATSIHISSAASNI